MQLEKRILKLDYLKGILISLMVYAHYIQIPENKFIFMYMGYGVNGWIYTFHMPMLALISGYIAGRLPLKNFKEGVIKRSLYLVFPCIIWGVFGIALDCILGLNKISLTTIKSYCFSGRAWFVMAIIGSNGLCWFLRKLFQRNRKIFIMNGILSFVVIVLISEKCSSFFLAMKYIYFFYCAAYIYGRYSDDWEERIKKGKWLGAIFFLILFFLFGIDLYGQTSFQIFTGHSTPLNGLIVNIYIFVLKLFSSCLIYILLEGVEKYVHEKIYKMLVKFGEYSLIIYLVHWLFRSLVLKMEIVFYNEIELLLFQLIVAPIFSVVTCFIAYKIGELASESYFMGILLNGRVKKNKKE